MLLDPIVALLFQFQRQFLPAGADDDGTDVANRYDRIEKLLTLERGEMHCSVADRFDFPGEFASGFQQQLDLLAGLFCEHRRHAVGGFEIDFAVRERGGLTAAELKERA